MLLTDIIAKREAASELTPRAMAAYLGLSPAAYWDIKDGSDPAIVLKFAAFVRFCVLFPDNIADLLSSISDLDGPIMVISFTEIKARVGDIAQQADELGLDAEAVKEFTAWFEDEWSFADIRLDTLDDICDYHGIDIRGVLVGYLASIGVNLDV